MLILLPLSMGVPERSFQGFFLSSMTIFCKLSFF